MQMHEVIQSRRRALGLTQEQIADALGVTAPAVNKWEKGATCPDIVLLAPLARLLGVDLNELMCFHENLTEQEAQRFTLEVMQTADRDGLEAGFALAREKLRAYPNCDMLYYNLAAVLQGLVLYSADADARKAYEDQLMEWYGRAANSEDVRLRDRASMILASLAINNKDWAAAQRAIEALPERPPIDKRTMQARLCSAQGKPEEAAQLLEHVVLASAQELYSAMLSLVDAEIAAGDLKAARMVAAASEASIKSLDLWAYIAPAAPFQVAVAEKDVQESVRRLEQLLATIGQPWKPFESPLYRRIAAQDRLGTINERIFTSVLEDLTTNPNYDFMRKDTQFQKLLESYQNLAKT